MQKPILRWMLFLVCPVLASAAKAPQPGSVAPVLFEPNRGQAPAEARYVALARGYRLLLERDAAVFEVGSERARLTFAGANPRRIAGESPTQAVRNYYVGSDPANWRSGIPMFERVRYERALPGVDLIFYSRPELEFDLALDAGVDPAQIELRYQGFRSLEIDADGALRLETGAGILRQHLPEVTQGGRHIPARYVRRGANTIGIELGAFDAGKPLLIDPTVTYVTYFGGSGAEGSSALVSDPEGNYYIAAQTNSGNYPRRPEGQSNAGDFDLAVTKFHPDSNAMIYSTIIGGSGVDTPHGLAVDFEGSGYVTYLSFTTASTNFPKPPASVLGGGVAGLGVLKLDILGRLSITAVLNTPGSGSAFGVGVDASHNVWLTGGTTGIAGQAGTIQANTAGGTDIFVARLNATISQVTWFTYLGTSADESASRVAVDAAGNVYVSGNGGSSAFPTGPSSAFPGAGSFVVKLDPVNNRILFAKYLSGGGGGGGLVVDGADVWVVANSTGQNFAPTSDAAQSGYGGGVTDGILVRANSSDGAIRYATYLGGSGNDFANALTMDVFGNLVVSGNTTSTNFPTTSDGARRSLNGTNSDMFVAVIDPGGRLAYGSYLGGTGTDFGSGVAVDTRGNVILFGSTDSTDLPVTDNALQLQFNGPGRDVFIARIEFVGVNDPYLLRAAIQNAASFAGGPVAPGEIITIYPKKVGPQTIVTATVTSDRRISTLLAGTRVLFDDVPAPIVYTLNEQVSVAVPYEVQGKSYTRIVVEYNGVRSRPTTIAVVPTAPGVFTSGSGTGPAVVINQDGSVNGPGNAAARGSIVVFFVTGEGQTTPAGVTGKLNEFTRLEDFPRPVASVTVTIGGQNAEILYAAGAPGFLAGLMQINARVPQSAQTGAAVALGVTIGSTSSQTPLTMAVQ
jgi:uncharacterized protein (TIGR03437 family)